MAPKIRGRDHDFPQILVPICHQKQSGDAKTEIDRGIPVYVTAASEVMDGYPIDII